MAIAIRISATDTASPTINKVTREVAGLGTTAEQAQSGVGGLTGALGKLGLAGLGIQTVVGAVAGLGKALVDPIMAASDLEESINKVQVVFGDSSKIITDFAKTSAQSLGQSQAAALGAAGTFGNLFVSMGLGQKDAAELSTQIVTLGSDLASFNNIKPEDALEKLRAGLVGESEPLRALGVNLNEAAVAEEALRLGLGKSAQTLTDSAKIQARYSLILQQTKTAQGDFARTSTGMANALRIIDASFADLRTQIGSRFLPIIAPLISQVAVALPRAMDAVKPVLDRAGAAFASVAQTVGRFVTNLRDKGLLTALRGLGGEVGAALLAGLRSVADFAGGVVAWLRQQIASINWGQVWSAVRNTTAGLIAGLGSIADQVTTWVADQWRQIDWGAVWKSVTGIATGLVTGIGDIIGTVTTWVGTQWANVDWEKVWKEVHGHGEALRANLAPITDDVELWLADQIRAIDWPQVWAAAATGTRFIRTLTQLMHDTDASPLGAGIADLLIRAIRQAVAIATGADQGFAEAGPLMAAGFAKAMATFPFEALNATRGAFLAVLRGGFQRAVQELDLSPFTAGLRRAVTDAVAAIFPLRIGPLTIGLGGVSVDVSGVATAARNVVPGGAAPTQPIGGPSVVGEFQHGGAFRVGGSGGPDSQLVSFRATPGEVVAVGHQRGSAGAGGGPVHVAVNLGGVTVRGQADEERLVARLVSEIEGVFTDGLRGARGAGVRYPLGVNAPASG
jgi:hypothetical protein